MDYDLIVAGGGPAGLRLAQRVAEAGRAVVVVDDRASIGLRKICTGIIGAEAFSQLDLPTGTVLNQIQHLRFVSPAGAELDYRHDSVLARVVDRSAFDAELAREAKRVGVCILSGSRVSRLEFGSPWVEAEVCEVKTGDRARILRAPCAVIATGVNSRLNRAAGLGSPVEFLNAAQAHIRVRELDVTTCFAGNQVAPGAFAWMVPLNPGWARIGLMTEAKAGPQFSRLLARLQPFRMDESVVEPDLKPIVQRFEGPSFARRVLAVGEAAGQVKTTTGGGIYYGLLGAEIGAEVLLQAFRKGSFEAGDLAAYERAWKAKLQAEIDCGYQYRRLFSRMTDRQIEGLFRFARNNGLIPLVRRNASFDWHLNILKAVSGYGIIPRLLNSLSAEGV